MARSSIVLPIFSFFFFCCFWANSLTGVGTLKTEFSAFSVACPDPTAKWIPCSCSGLEKEKYTLLNTQPRLDLFPFDPPL